VRSQARLLAVAATGAIALGLVACGGSNDSAPAPGQPGGGGGGSGGSGQGGQLPTLAGTSITGAGATFPEPIYKLWAQQFQQQTQAQVNYQGIGSGGGIAQLTAKTVNFGATDVPMKPEELQEAEAKGGQVQHFPTVLGAVTVAYNVQGVQKGLKLDGPTIADMFLGKVKRWNDPAIAKLNPGVQLPSTPITVVHRSDESGTTGLFTQYLSEVSPQWKRQVGADKSVEWPTGTGGKGNPGVAAGVSRTNGAIGYVELTYALAENLTTALVENKAGRFVEPNLQSTSAAGEGLKLPADLRFTAINAPGPNAYPIASATFIIAYRDLCRNGNMDQTKARGVKAFLTYAMNQGQQTATQLKYAPLPADLKQKAVSAVDQLTCNGQPINLNQGQ
jgi:phosphate transport system substrate-binding protein